VDESLKFQDLEDNEEDIDFKELENTDNNIE